METTPKVIKRSAEYGDLCIARAEYDRMRKHDYAGPDGEGMAWVMTAESEGTTLWKGVRIEDFPRCACGRELHTDRLVLQRREPSAADATATVGASRSCRRCRWSARRKEPMPKHTHRLWRAHLVDESGRAVIFYLYAPNADTAADEAERQTDADCVMVDDCTPRSRERLAA